MGVAEAQCPLVTEPPGGMETLFTGRQRAVWNTAAIAEHCSGFSLPEWLRARYAFHEVEAPAGTTRSRGWSGSAWRRRGGSTGGLMRRRGNGWTGSSF